MNLTERYHSIYARWSGLPQFEKTLVLAYFFGCVHSWAEHDESVKTEDILDRLERSVKDQEEYVAKYTKAQ